jgi:hypothetical protein
MPSAPADNGRPLVTDALASSIRSRFVRCDEAVMSVERQVDTQSSVDTGVDVGAAAAVELSVERAALSKSKFETMGTDTSPRDGVLLQQRLTAVCKSGSDDKPSRAGIGLGLPQSKEVSPRPCSLACDLA